MRIVVVGGSGLVGAQLVSNLRHRGHDVVAASRRTGVNTLTGDGLDAALAGASVVIDVTNSPSFEDIEALEFFTTSYRNLLAAAQAAHIKHHVLLSIVGTDRLLESGYFRAKTIQEDLTRMSSIPHTILRSTQFYEFMPRIPESDDDERTVRASPHEIVQRVMHATQDAREVITDPYARYFGAKLSEDSLTPDEGAIIGVGTFDDWLNARAVHVSSLH